MKGKFYHFPRYKYIISLAQTVVEFSNNESKEDVKVRTVSNETYKYTHFSLLHISIQTPLQWIDITVNDKRFRYSLINLICYLC